MANSIGPRDNTQHAKLLCRSKTSLRKLVLTATTPEHLKGFGTITPVSYDSFVGSGKLSLASSRWLQKAQSSLCAEDVINLQFTSGMHPEPPLYSLINHT
jgi:hypothetical protein